jgi:hypothetical protein
LECAEVDGKHWMFPDEVLSSGQRIQTSDDDVVVDDARYCIHDRLAREARGKRRDREWPDVSVNCSSAADDEKNCENPRSGPGSLQSLTAIQ